jgi:hypothetical protein
MPSILAIASERALPIVRADGSLNVRSVAVPEPAGVGVAGIAVGTFDVAGAGAAGGAGVWAIAGAGVDGAAAVLEEDAGAGLGYVLVSLVCSGKGQHLYIPLIPCTR